MDGLLPRVIILRESSGAQQKIYSTRIRPRDEGDEIKRKEKCCHSFEPINIVWRIGSVKCKMSDDRGQGSRGCEDVDSAGIRVWNQFPFSMMPSELERM
ncbi:hypothetical protein CEXT_457871 [Caerostris extrusa]|uniref:Uncharacterized protein n=1 Tax=Caerostris extrusa TaxID=172846 RepID=A0AAV4P005_CAEEX|nr:hypothetical protein CEXT_457871 [Caerostris extrusa]